MRDNEHPTGLLTAARSKYPYWEYAPHIDWDTSSSNRTTSSVPTAERRILYRLFLVLVGETDS
jgi:hypothetical protein